jgi:ankyrin repeat protein
MMACSKGHVDCVCALLEAGSPVEQAKPDGATALMRAYGRDLVECVRTLL